MKIRKLTTVLIILPLALYGQKVEKLIKQKDVTRIVQTLSADNMMGRSALTPANIEKATVFIEREFKSIGLQPLTGLTGFRQEFTKERVVPSSVEVIVEGQRVTDENLMLVSEKTDISIESGLLIKIISFDPKVDIQNQNFFPRVFGIVGDTSSAIVLVAPEFQQQFTQIKGYYARRFTTQSKSTKVFILGKNSAATYSIKVKQRIEPVKMANVVGVLPGKTKPDEMVIFSGHYDHIGIQKAIDGDSIANGADDDASGTTAVIALARYFKKTRNNNRTLIFVAFTAEEIGGFGSKQFSQQLQPDKVMAMFNIEMIGKPSKWGTNSAFITGFEKSDLGQILQKNQTGTPFQFQPDPYPEQDLFYRSDNATMARLGVPAHSISTDQIPIDKFYHTVNDEVGTLDMNNVTEVIRAIARGSRTIVSGDDTPRRIDKAGVR